MKFVTIKSETSLADLSREVFEIKGAKAAAADDMRTDDIPRAA